MITTTEVQRLARAALLDERPPDGAPYHTDHTIKIALARFVERVLGAELAESEFWRKPTVEPGWVNCAIGCVHPDLARAYAAALWRAADEAESKEGR